jgi:hypothetical protein
LGDPSIYLDWLRNVEFLGILSFVVGPFFLWSASKKANIENVLAMQTSTAAAVAEALDKLVVIHNSAAFDATDAVKKSISTQAMIAPTPWKKPKIFSLP